MLGMQQDILLPGYDVIGLFVVKSDVLQSPSEASKMPVRIPVQAIWHNLLCGATKNVGCVGDGLLCGS